MRVDEKSGDLVLVAPGGSELRQRRPRVYQQFAGKRLEIPGAYRLLGRGRAAFTLAAYDRNRSLVIDPTVDFTTFYGGSSADEPYAIAVDDDGNTYITGGTFSRDFPTTNGSKFEFCKPFGFSGFCGMGQGNAIAVDSTGVYVPGEIFPPDIDNIIGSSDNNNGDTVVWRLEAKGGLQDYFQILGVDGTDFPSAIGLDSLHNVWVAGAVYSGDSIDTASSGDVDAFELAPDGRFLHDFRFGSNKEDVPLGMAIGPETADRPWITEKPAAMASLQRMESCTG